MNISFGPASSPPASPNIEPKKDSFAFKLVDSKPADGTVSLVEKALAANPPAAPTGVGGSVPIGGVTTPMAASSNSAVAGVLHPNMPEKILSAKVIEFKDHVKALYSKFPQKEMLGMVMKRILVDLNDNPELEEFLAPEDRGQMIRALRDNYSIAVEAKRAKHVKKKPKKESAFANIGELLAMEV